jgi:hypothetical protein
MPFLSNTWCFIRGKLPIQFFKDWELRPFFKLISFKGGQFIERNS